jgi:hypothetical protein
LIYGFPLRRPRHGYLNRVVLSYLLGCNKCSIEFKTHLCLGDVEDVEKQVVTDTTCNKAVCVDLAILKTRVFYEV